MAIWVGFVFSFYLQSQDGDKQNVAKLAELLKINIVLLEYLFFSPLFVKNAELFSFQLYQWSVNQTRNPDHKISFTNDIYFADS